MKSYTSVVIAEKVLEKAINIVKGQRQDDYGSAEDSFEMISDLFTAFGARMFDGGSYRPVKKTDTAGMMIMLKMAREKNKSKLDNMVDVCGYAALNAGVALTDKFEDFAQAIAMGQTEAEQRQIAGSNDVYEMFKEIVRENTPGDGEDDAVG